MDLIALELVAGAPPVLHVGGEVDIASAHVLHAGLAEALTKHPDVVVDMGGVTFIDAAGLRVILQVAATLNGGGPLTLVHAGRVARLLDLVGLAETPTIAIREEL